ncbi:hypothetical protein [Sinanaerobacter chloroacetimidivorans]|jgi:hypothetical protein|uniref:Uncharacterized protein n=1 Tax=Sinanaerobacter chloroacetimidivorans TaxID=2818044 RepID=A0A8J8B1W5_9FIRM|nr:hypothetical protein [Sinanaerobacter chloroacetimidivorans]MBR0598162.1 hypothetical protein [Sinanaerobacter chloroacetimidivorans]
MFRYKIFSNYNLLMKASDRISKNEQSNEEVVNALRKEDYDHVPFNILKFIEEPS